MIHMAGRGNPNHTPWTDEDVRMLEEAYNSWPPVLPDELLERHVRHSCHTRAHRTGIRSMDRQRYDYSRVTPAEWAYFAGIIDGEGTVYRYSHKSKGSKCGVTVANTDKPLIDWMVDTFPGSSLYLRPPSGHRWKPCWAVRWMSVQAIQGVLGGTVEHMIVKRQKAVDLLAHLTGHPSSALT